jgi:CAAX protease family protein
MQYTLTTGIGFWGAALVLSGLFALGHARNPGETSVGVMDVFLGGMVLALMLRRTGNLWFPIGFHAAWDWAQSFVFGVADSGMKSAGAWLMPHIPQNKPWWLTGGTVGPEGSVFSCCIELLLLVLVAWRFRSPRYPEGVDVVTTTPEPSSAAAALSPPATRTV